MLNDLVEIEFSKRKIMVREILNGDVACPGDYREGEYLFGIARRVAKNCNKVEKSFEFNEGEVLVTQMTDPSMENEMARSSAIVTEIGGEMCHAAIVSNNLNRFCIVGTNEAMRKIEDGDRLYLTYRLVNDQSGEYYQGVVLKEDGLSS